ncbi:MAG: PTS system fructose-specific EIIABC component [Calditrichaeota bacterium]|nr:PTS system fructose-specific EIIABC component [Calditrichota bacterium]
MRLSDLLHEQTIDLSVRASDKEGVIRALVQRVADEHGLDAETVTGNVLARERALSTGVGQGVAVPHATVPGLDEPVIGFGRTADGVEFDSLDDEPVFLIFLLLSPDGDIPLHLKLLSRVSRLCQHAPLREGLRQVRTAADALDTIRRAESNFQEL